MEALVASGLSLANARVAMGSVTARALHPLDVLDLPGLEIKPWIAVFKEFGDVGQGVSRWNALAIMFWFWTRDSVSNADPSLPRGRYPVSQCIDQGTPTRGYPGSYHRL